MANKTKPWAIGHMDDIRFAWICRDIHFDEVVRVELTDEMIVSGERPSWITTDNCELIAKVRSTYLFDRNGREIFEGDIVEAHSEGKKGIFEVRWRQQGAPMFILFPAWQHGETWHLHGVEQPDGTFADSVIVIGNIYENPDLLETAVTEEVQ